MKVLNNVKPEQREDANILLEQKMAERFINDAIHNRELNITKNDRHRFLIKIIMLTFIVMFITFSVGVLIDFYESKHTNENIKHTYEEVKKMSNDDVIKMETDIVIKDVNDQPIPVEVQLPEYLTETFAWDGIDRSKKQSK